MFRFFTLLAGLCLVFSALVPAQLHAEDVSDKEAIEALNEDIDEQMKIASEERKQAAEDTYDKVNDLMLELPKREQKHFFLAYTNYNLIETVKVVQKDVGTAIDKCGENNPDMKSDLRARFKEWNGALKPLIKDAEAQFKSMLAAQDYASKGEIKNIFDSVDNTRDKTYNQIEKIPVTTPEACQYLLSKMDETQENMTNILNSTLLNFPQVWESLELQEMKQDDASRRKSGESEKVE